VQVQTQKNETVISTISPFWKQTGFILTYLSCIVNRMCGAAKSTTYFKELSPSVFFPRYCTTLSSVWTYKSPAILSRTPDGSTPGPKGIATADWQRQ